MEMPVRICGQELLDGGFLHRVDKMYRQRCLAANLPHEDGLCSIRLHKECRCAQNVKRNEETGREKRNQVRSHFSLKYFSAPAFIGRDIPAFAVSFVICLPTACAACRRSRFEKIAFVML